MAEHRDIAWCNANRVEVLFDADVLINAFNNPAHVHRASLVSVQPALRFRASSTLYEVSYALRGNQPQLREFQRALSHQFLLKPAPMTEQVGRRFEELLRNYAPGLRARMGLGDALLAAWSRENPERRRAIATHNRADFEDLPVLLVDGF